MPERYLIAGVGNTLRRDDGVGIKALEYLRNKLNPRDFDFLEFVSPGVDLLNYIGKYCGTFIIDAVDFKVPAGCVKSFSLNDIDLNVKKHKTSSHSFTLKDFLKLYRMLNIKAEVCVIGIQPKDISYGQELSPEVAKSFPAILSRIKTMVK